MTDNCTIPGLLGKPLETAKALIGQHHKEYKNIKTLKGNETLKTISDDTIGLRVNTANRVTAVQCSSARMKSILAEKKGGSNSGTGGSKNSVVLNIDGANVKVEVETKQADAGMAATLKGCLPSLMNKTITQAAKYLTKHGIRYSIGSTDLTKNGNKPNVRRDTVALLTNNPLNPDAYVKAIHCGADAWKKANKLTPKPTNKPTTKPTKKPSPTTDKPSPTLNPSKIAKCLALKEGGAERSKCIRQAMGYVSNCFSELHDLNIDNAKRIIREEFRNAQVMVWPTSYYSTTTPEPNAINLYVENASSARATVIAVKCGSNIELVDPNPGEEDDPDYPRPPYYPEPGYGEPGYGWGYGGGLQNQGGVYDPQYGQNRSGRDTINSSKVGDVSFSVGQWDQSVRTMSDDDMNVDQDQNQLSVLGEDWMKDDDEKDGSMPNVTDSIVTSSPIVLPPSQPPIIMTQPPIVIREEVARVDYPPIRPTMAPKKKGMSITRIISWILLAVAILVGGFFGYRWWKKRQAASLGPDADFMNAGDDDLDFGMPEPRRPALGRAGGPRRPVGPGSEFDF